MKLRLICALLLVPAAAYAAAALSIEFNGVLVQGTTADGKPKIQVSLLNPNTGSAKWVTVGTGTFDSYTVSACNVLAVKTNGTPVQNPTVSLISFATKAVITISLKSSLIVATTASDAPPPENTAMPVNTTPSVDVIQVQRAAMLSEISLDPALMGIYEIDDEETQP